MRNLKKLLAVVLAVTVMLTAMSTVFAEDTTATAPDAATICQDLNALQGDGSDWSAYLAKDTTKAQLALILIRLRGEEAAAKAYTGTEKFNDDATTTTFWKPIMEYTKAHQELGFGGDENGNFNPTQNATAQMLNKVLLTALGYAQGTDFAWEDVPGFAKAKGLTEVTGSIVINNADVAAALVQALKTKLKSGDMTLADSIAATNDTFKTAAIKDGVIVPATIASVTAPADVDAKVGDVVDLSKTIPTVKATMSDGKTQDVAVTWGTVDTSKAATVAVKGTIAGFDAGVSVNVVVGVNSPVVSDIKMDNLKQITVSFNKAMDVDNTFTTSTVTVYKNGSTTAETVDVTASSDKKVMYITLGSNANQSDSFEVVLDGVKDSEGLALAKYDKTGLIAKDVTSPVVTGVTLNNYMKLTVAFSEPITVPTSAVYVNDNSLGIQVKVDGAAVFAKYTNDPDNGQVVVDLASGLAVGDHKITVSDAKDYAGFKIDAKDFTVTRVEDTTGPKATSVTYETKNKIMVSFDEDVYTVASDSFSVKEAGSSTEKFASVATALPAKDIELNLSTLTIGSTIGLTVVVNNVTDIYGNKTTTAVTLTAKANDDAAKPTVVSVTPEAGNILKVVFNKEVDAATGSTKFVLLNSDDSTNQAVYTVTDYDTTTPDNKTFKVQFSNLNSVNPGAYKVKVTGVADTSIRSNVMDDATIAITAIDTKAPTIGSISAINATTKQIVVMFSEPVDVASASNTANWFFGTSSLDMKSLNLISGGAVSVSGATATITLDAATYTVLACPAVTDKAGNLLSGAGSAFGSLASVNTLPTFTSANIEADLTATDTLVVTALGGRTFSSVDATNFKFTTDGANANNNVTVQWASLSSDNTAVTLHLSTGMSAYKTIYDNVALGQVASSLFISGANIKDQYGTVLTIAAGAPATIVDQVKATQADFVALTGTTEYINFDEPIQYATGISDTTMAAGLQVVYNGTTYVPVTAAPGAGQFSVTCDTANKRLIVTLGTTAADATLLSIKILRADFLTDTATTPNGVNVK